MLGTQHQKAHGYRMNTMKQAIAYIRVSTHEQATEGVSLEAQQAQITAWCERNGYHLAEVCIDAGISGSRMDNRPALGKALSLVQAGNALVFYSLSRLGRSTRDILAISDQLQACKADMVSLSEQFDTTTAAGKLMFGMLALLAEFERGLVSERTKMALAQKKAIGEVYSPIPYGFKEVEGRLVQANKEATVVTDILDKRNQGRSYGAIAAELNANGIPSKRGGRWYASTVHYVIKRQAA
jgi:DNA invertase Pin-like site-specific DNA recombinase